MADARVFDCPSCGARLTTDGTQVQVTCESCGNVVTVPLDLRVNPVAAVKSANPKEQLAAAFSNLVTAAGAERAAEEQAITSHRRSRLLS